MILSFRYFRPIAVLALIAGAESHSALARSTGDSAGVAAALEHYVGFVRQMASDSIAELYTADGELLATGRPPIVGPKAIQAFLDSFSAYHVLADSMKPATLEVRGDTALQTGTFWQLVQVPAGDTVVAHSGFEILWLRDRQSGWRVRRMGTTPPP